MLTGDTAITGFDIDLFANRSFYSEDFSVVPEPSVLALTLIGVISLAQFRSRFIRRQPKARQMPPI